MVSQAKEGGELQAEVTEQLTALAKAEEDLRRGQDAINAEDWPTAEAYLTAATEVSCIIE